MIVYCPDFTNQSKLASGYLKDINKICFRDYKEAYFHDPLMCLDLDAYEASCSGDNDATMDAATGIADYQNNQMSSPRHLLIELRFGYKSTQNFDLGNIKRKVSHSKSILSPERVHGRVAFIFTPEMAPRAQNFFSRLAKVDHEVNSWDAMDVEGFRNSVLDASKLPYQAETDLDAIVSDMNKKYSLGGLDSLDIILKYWIERMELYNLRYKLAESNEIAKVILTYLQSIRVVNSSFEAEFLALRMEDISYFIQK